MTWHHYKEGAFDLIQSKTKKLVHIPCHTTLRQVLDGMPRVSVHILTINDKPIDEHYFRKRWTRITKTAGLTGLLFMDLRRTAVIRLAEAECTVPQIASITGHSIDDCQKIINTYWTATKAQSQAAILKYEKRKVANTPKKSG
jgi:integrase